METVRAKAKKTKPAPARKAKVSRGFPRLRIAMGKGLILGPGKVDLLEAIERKGSISAASREMGMSYRRAWLLVDALNTMFGQPLVVAAPAQHPLTMAATAGSNPRSTSVSSRHGRHPRKDHALQA